VKVLGVVSARPLVDYDGNERMHTITMSAGILKLFLGNASIIVSRHKHNDL